MVTVCVSLTLLLVRILKQAGNFGVNVQVLEEEGRLSGARNDCHPFRKKSTIIVVQPDLKAL